METKTAQLSQKFAPEAPSLGVSKPVGSGSHAMGTEQAEGSSPLLPRSAWVKQLTRLRLLMKAKQILDRQESHFYELDPYNSSGN